MSNTLCPCTIEDHDLLPQSQSSAFSSFRVLHYQVFRFEACIQGYVEEGMSPKHVYIKVNIHHGYDENDVHRLFP